jgi:hypothetical protein
MICEYGERRWNDIDGGKPLIRPKELSGNPISSHLIAKQEEIAMKIMSVCLTKRLLHNSNASLIRRKILRGAADGFTSPPNEGVLRIIMTLKNASPFVRFEPANLGSNGKQANQQTIKDDIRLLKKNLQLVTF